MDEKYPLDEKKVKFRPNAIGSKKESKNWVLMIFIISFILSAFLTLLSSNILEDVNLYVAFLVVLIIVLVNIVFDVIGTAVTAADEAPFHAMASRKLYGARQSIRLIRNADKVSNFCNDVIGDICGVISGSASAYIIIKVAQSEQRTLAELIITGIVASLTVGGKSIGKTFAIKHSNYIVYKVSVLLKFTIGRINLKKVIKKNKKEKK